MKRIVLVVALLLPFISIQPTFAAAKSGASCSKIGATSSVSGKKFTCIKSGKKLVWDKGAVVKKSSKPVTEVPTLSKSTVQNDTNSNPSFNLENLPTTLNQPSFLSQSSSKNNFVIKFQVDKNAEAGYIEVKEIGLNFQNTLTNKDSNDSVTVSAEIPNTFTGNELKIFYYSYSKTSRSSCCSAVNIQINNSSSKNPLKKVNYGPDINNYVIPPRIQSVPNTYLTQASTFSNLNPCKLKDGDPILDNMTIGFPVPNGRTDLSKPVKVAVLGADFSDAPAASNPSKDYETAIKTMEHFWEKQASNGLDIEMFVSSNYKRMAKTVAQYQLGSSLNGFNGENYWVFIQAVIDAYDSEIDFTGVSTVVVVVPSSVTAEQIGTWVVYTQGTFRSNEATFYNVMITGNGNSKAAPTSWVHEYGHTLGLTDMRYVNEAMPTDQKPEGLGIYDVMGSGNNAPDILVWSRFLTNMLLPNQIHCVINNESSTHWLIPIEQQLPELKGVIIPLTDYTAIVIESRRNYGYDVLEKEGEGALVYTIDTRTKYRRSPAFIVTPARSKDLEWYRDAALQINEFVITNGWKITVVETGDFGDVVKVEKVS